MSTIDVSSSTEAAPAPAASENFRKLPNSADRLTEAQRLAIELLVSGKRLGVVAASVGVSARSLYTWRHDDADFIAELNRRRHELWDESADHLRALVHEAVDVMEWHLRDRYDRNRFRAASAILSTSNIRSVIPVAVDPD